MKFGRDRVRRRPPSEARGQCDHRAFTQAARDGGTGTRSRFASEEQTCSVRTRAAIFSTGPSLKIS